MSFRGLTLALVACFASVPASFGLAGDLWPQWRGPTRDGQAPGPSWPDGLQGERLQELWRVKLDQGYPGPIVAEDRVFVAETRDKKEEVVRALDRKTGQELWKVSWPGAMSVPFFAASNGSWIRSTPAYDGRSLYVAGMKDVLVCLDAQTGEERWRVDFTQRYKTELPAFGFVCSPLVEGDNVYVQAGASFLKLDKKTGDTVWRVLEDEGGMNGSAFSSPCLATLQGVPQILVQGRDKLHGVDPQTGKTLWSQEIPAFRGMNILTPTPFMDGVFTSTYGGRSLMLGIDRRDDGFAVSQRWDNKLQGYMSSPVVIDGHAYLHLKNQRFCCIDLKTGETPWTTKPFGQYWSMVANKDRILALDQRGELLLIRADPKKFDLLDSRKISEAPAWGHLAVSGDELFVREQEAIVAYRWK